MGSHPERSKERKSSQATSNDQLGHLIGQALRDSVANADPSPEVWCRIQTEIAESRPVPRRRWEGLPRLLGLGPLVQATILGVLLLVFAMELGSESKFRMWVTERPTPMARVVDDVLQFGTDDVLSGVRIARSLRELTLWDYRLAPYVDNCR